MTQLHGHTNDIALRARAQRVVPGGMYGHLSATPMGPDYPQYIASAKGCRIRDVDGNEYIDFMCAFGPNLLGYGHPGVEAAAALQRAEGDTMTGPSPRMVELAEAFVDMVDHADWVLFAKNGTDATTVCLNVARAATGKRVVLRARGAYHGAAPWSTPVKDGILREARAHVLRFDYNDIASLEKAVDEAGTDLAAILVTAFKHETYQDQELPTLAFARRARELCDKHGAALIVDDVRAGMRVTHGCSWETLGVNPDLSAWSKAVGNGHPIAMVAGSDSLRDAGGRVFATGSFWFSAVPMAAAIATIDIARKERVVEHMQAMGTLLREGIARQATAHGFRLRQSGPPQMPQMLFDDDPKVELGTRWTGAVARRGVYLHPYHNMFLCAAHTEADIRQALDATEEAFAELARAR